MISSNQYLAKSQFQSINGNCWASMIGQYIIGSALAALTLMPNLQNASGRFLITICGDSLESNTK